MKSVDLTENQKQIYKQFVLNEALFYMIKEYEFWVNNRSVKVSFKSKEYILNIYNPDTLRPRPESYSEDIKTAKTCKDDKQRAILYKNIAAGINAYSKLPLITRWVVPFCGPIGILAIERGVLVKVEPFLNKIFILNFGDHF